MNKKVVETLIELEDKNLLQNKKFKDFIKNTKINEKSPISQQFQQRKKTRGIIDGVFDMTHFGHFNAIRQAKKNCDTLIVLINSDKSVLKEKGPVVLKE